jgi:Tachylectin/Trypsin
MNPKRFWRAMRCRVVRIALAAISVIAFAIGIAAQEEKIEIGKVTQGLVAAPGQEVPVEKQEEFGLLMINSPRGDCSASLLRNDWVITAAHCLEFNNPPPGMSKLVRAQDIEVTAKWGGGQSIKGIQLEFFRPNDIAIIKVAAPFTVNGKTTGYSRAIWNNQYPYFGQLTPIPIVVFGRGINQFASGSGATAIPAMSDGLYRVGYAKTHREAEGLYWYPSNGTQMVAGGDSGGPSFTALQSGHYVLMGVHSNALVLTIPGKPKDWTWVYATTEAGDAPVRFVWDRISKFMGPEPSPPVATVPALEPPKPGYIGAFDTSTKPDKTNILYTVSADGTLTWHEHLIAGLVDPTPTPSGSGYIVVDGRVVKAPVTSAKPVKITGRARLPQHGWKPEQPIGTGWAAGLKDVMPGGQQSIYALGDDGSLRWYWHAGALDGSRQWQGPKPVGIGWGVFSKIIPMDNGVFYGISPDGMLRWHRHDNYRNGEGLYDGWASAMNVGWGWNSFKMVFSGGQGILYVVANDGSLLWYRHNAYLNPIPIQPDGATNAQKLAWERSWEGPKEVGTGWGGCDKLFSPGEGHIYCISPNGDLFWFHHLGWRDGTFNWTTRAGGVKIGSGWNAFVFAFAHTVSDAGIVVK